MIFYFLLILASAVFFLRALSGRKISRPLMILISINLTFLVLYHFVNALSGNGFDESVVYHIVVGLNGAGIFSFLPLIFSALAVITICILVALYLSKQSLNENRRQENFAVSAALTVGFISALVANPLVVSVNSQLPLLKAAVFQRDNLDSQLSRFLESKIGTLIQTKLSAEYPHDGSAAAVAVPKNIIWIYVESLEKTYLEREVFGDLLPNLSEQARFARQYSDVKQPWGTGWTIGGIVGSQCGMPLVTLGAQNVNSLTELPEFMPGATCAGDLLSQIGYSVEFIGGASKEFAGKGNFLETHGFRNIQDRVTLSRQYNKGSVEQNEWGFYDDLLLSVVKDRATALHSAGRPFLLNALTLDTHSPHGFVSPSCRPKSELAHATSVGAAIRCSDYLLSDFISWFRASDLFTDSILVISSDHLSMPNDLKNDLDSISNDRRLLFWVIGNDVETGIVDEPASTFDIGATVLALALSNADVSIGLGRNIDNFQALYEQEFNDQDLAKNISGFQALAWNYTSGSETIYANSSENSFHMGGHIYSFPVLIEFEDGLFSNLSWIEKARRERYIDLINDDKLYVWIDSCGWSAASQYQGNTSSCIHLVDQGEIISSIPLAEKRVTEVKADQIESMFTARSESTSSSISIQSLAYAVSESGPGNKAGVIGAVDALGTRGINFFQKKGNGRNWVLVDNVDYCDKSVDRSEFNGSSYSASDMLLIVVKDSSHCGNLDNLRSLATKLRLTKLGTLDFRQPYIGLINPDNNQPVEFVGDVGLPMIVALP